ncbi:MAG: ATP-dependent sacrificial sulfur transferase LarE [Lentisphaeraceae bacterium]|nr:ATP-dependent sacrificial sulfur transferase LarE [Lentisphaeraceae bacterium]
MITESLQTKEQQLSTYLKDQGSIAVAFSGGVDSTYLASVAHDALGTKARIIIADSPSIPRSELDDAIKIANDRQWNLEVIKTTEHLNESYQANSGDRCYFCKNELFSEMSDWCKQNNISKMAYGAIMDDLGDHRPGAVAAEQHLVLAPLQEVKLSKEEIRHLSQARNLPTANKASFACLASRLPVGEEVTVKKLSQIEMAEEILKELKVSQYRARHHGDTCRIEVGEEDFPILFDKANRQYIVESLKKIGYKHIALDLAGYRTGSTNGLS